MKVIALKGFPSMEVPLFQQSLISSRSRYSLRIFVLNTPCSPPALTPSLSLTQHSALQPGTKQAVLTQSCAAAGNWA